MINLINKKFGRLLVIQKSLNKSNCKELYWECICDCGKNHVVAGKHLRSGDIQSCGCFQREIVKKTAKETFTKHGLSNHSLYKVWTDMKTRCLNKNSSIYNYYGGRGITVCDEWLNNPEIFIQWALNNGWKKELEIDRINNDGNYEPNNCRFVSRRKNCSNTRKQKNRKLPIGIKKSRNKFVAEIGMKGKKRYLGTFTTAIEAQEVREKFVLNNIL